MQFSSAANSIKMECWLIISCQNNFHLPPAKPKPNEKGMREMCNQNKWYTIDAIILDDRELLKMNELIGLSTIDIEFVRFHPLPVINLH